MNFLLNICNYFVSTMDRGQTMDVVDTPAHDRRDLPSIEDFREPEERLKWRDVQPEIYKILERFNHRQNKFGPSFVLKLESKNGTTFFVWAPSSLVFAMEKMKSAKFISNLGVKLSETGSLFLISSFVE